MRRKKKQPPRRLSWRSNHQIHAHEVRVIGSDGKQLGILKLSEAIAQANKEGLDLVEIAPRAKPPVTKIVNLGKFRYQEGKKTKKKSKSKKSGEIKEIRFSPFIGGADYHTRLERVKDFLADGYKIRAVVKFKGRQMGSKQFGYNLLKRLLGDLDEKVAIDMEPKFLGRHLAMVISPIKKSPSARSLPSPQETLKKP